MIINTSRFGQVEIKEEDTILFPEGILGFGDFRKFILIDDPTDEIFAWLQSCEEPAIAFPVLEPELFTENYKISLARTDFDALKMKTLERARLYCIVTIPDDATLMTANMKAPIVINIANRSARQCVLQDNNLAIREPVFAKLQQRLIANGGQPFKRPASDSADNVAVRIPADKEL